MRVILLDSEGDSGFYRVFQSPDRHPLPHWVVPTIRDHECGTCGYGATPSMTIGHDLVRFKLMAWDPVSHAAVYRREP